MFEILALIVAIFLMVAVQMLRAVLAMPFARMRASFVPPVPPAPLAELFADATTQLERLGFGSMRGVLTARVDGESVQMPLRIVMQHADGTTVWLGPPPAPKRPHRLHVLYASRLADGRSALSQPFDAYFPSVQYERLVARIGTEATFEQQVAAHRSWIATLGSAPLPVDDALLADMAGPENERIRQALLARGDVRALTPDLAVPRFAFALRLLWSYLRIPNPPPDPRPVPVERLALLARAIDVVRHRAPPRTAQWILFAVSVLLFMAIGAVFWNTQVALSILVVVIVHELGHFLAMRAFGYRNVHILALPLVGGVAMGVDANPAATRRAWMSLMGPMPGIAIGWALLALVLSGNAPEWAAGWLMPLALIFLFINYLNVLPVPPLDGAHVLDAMLPPRMARLQVLVTGTAAVVGGYFAWQYGLPLLTALAALQLLGLPALWALHGVERDLAAAPGWEKESPQASKTLRVLRALERRLGPATNAVQRVNQASAMITRLDTRPMGHVARLLTGSVYAVLLAVPIAALVYFQEPWGMMRGAHAPDFEAQARARDALQAQAATLPLQRLLQPAAGAPADPASEQALAAAEARLGRKLPTELRNVYAVANGSEAAGLLPIERVAHAANVVDAWIAPFTQSMAIEHGGDWVELAPAEARTWWHLGGDEQAPLFYLPDGHPKLPGVRVVSYFIESPSAHADLRAWLASEWTSRVESERALAEQKQRTQAARIALASAPIAELLESWQPPSLLARVMSQDGAWPDGADESAIVATEQRLGVALPSDYRELLALHDGFPPLQLLPHAELDTWSARRAQIIAHARLFGDEARTLANASATALDAGGEPIADISDAALARCLVVASIGRADRGIGPRLLWCPPGTPQPGWLDLALFRRYVSFHEWLLQQALPIAQLRFATDRSD